MGTNWHDAGSGCVVEYDAYRMSKKCCGLDTARRGFDGTFFGVAVQRVVGERRSSDGRTRSICAEWEASPGQGRSEGDVGGGWTLLVELRMLSGTGELSQALRASRLLVRRRSSWSLYEYDLPF